MIPHSVLAAGWIPFVIVAVVLIIFSILYVRYYKSTSSYDVCSSIVCVLALISAFLASIVLPVDIFIVSFMKNPDGHYKDWAADPAVRQSLEDSVLCVYYVFYSFLIAFVFVLLPFAYFYNEETDEEESTRRRIWGTIKYTAVFLMFCTILLIIGGFAVTEVQTTHNITEWDYVKELFRNEWRNRGEDALSFAINAMSLFGMAIFILYTGYGISAWPLDLIRGRTSSADEQLQVAGDLEDVTQQIEAIHDKYAERGSSGRRNMTQRDRRRLDDLEEQKFVLSRRHGYLAEYRNSLGRCCNKCMRPFQITIGVVCVVLETFIVLSLVLTNVDKLLHSLGWRAGYILPNRKLPNLIDIALVFSQKVFPLDYILLLLLVMYLFFSTMAALQQLGVWCCWIKVYKLRKMHTRPQGMLFVCFLLIFIVLAFNVFLYELTPQYTTYGSQHYLRNITTGHNDTVKITQHLELCSTVAPGDECTMTQFSRLLMRFFFKVWFFGFCYYWATWLFIVAVILGFLVTICRKRRSNIEGFVDPDDMLSEDEDEPLLTA